MAVMRVRLRVRGEKVEKGEEHFKLQPFEVRTFVVSDLV